VEKSKLEEKNKICFSLVVRRILYYYDFLSLVQRFNSKNKTDFECLDFDRKDNSQSTCANSDFAKLKLEKKSSKAIKALNHDIFYVLFPHLFASLLSILIIK